MHFKALLSRQTLRGSMQSPTMTMQVPWPTSPNFRDSPESHGIQQRVNGSGNSSVVCSRAYTQAAIARVVAERLR